MSQFLETVRGEFNRLRGRYFAGEGYEGVEVAGICVVAADSGRILLAQRAIDKSDDPEVAETYEFPGGHLDEGEEPYVAALREFSEEVGIDLPAHDVVWGWRGGDHDQYQGFVVAVPTEFATPAEAWDPAEVQDVVWVDPTEADTLPLRPETAKLDLAALAAKAVSRNEEMSMDEETLVEAEAPEIEEMEEPDLDLTDLALGGLPIHGVLAPEDIESGDSRGFSPGAVTKRPYRLPFMWQEEQNSGHDKAVVVGSVDRLMRKDGLIHWEGSLMPSAKAGDFAELLAFFGRFGVSVDGDKGNLDAERTNASNVVWFDAVRAAGLTAVSIPAFAEAYVAFGPHPEMPDADDEEAEVMTASGDMVTFDRGPGWVTHPRETKRIHDYWTKKGQPGYAKIKWGTPGDFRRARALIGKKIGANSPEDLRFLNQIIAQWHYDALGYWPGELDKPGNKTSAEARAEREARRKTRASVDDAEVWEPVLTSSKFRDVPTDERKRLAEEGKAMEDGSFPIANCEDLRNAIQAIGRASDPEAAKRHIRKRHAALNCDVELPDTWAVETIDETPAFDLTLTASGARALPPMSYFERHPDTGNTVIEEPDENGIRRTYGYAAEWGVCHIGFEGRCVEPPADPHGGAYPEFHLGRTRTQEGYVRTGLITYGVQHRSAKQILSETATQAHYDDLSKAWAAVRLGEDERGIWFSGVVLPTVEEEWITTIEASGQVSGEWKHGALRTLLTVNVPGFPVMTSSAEFDEEGNLLALSAAAFGTVDNGTAGSECDPEPTPAERMAALAAVDAEVRFAALKKEWEAR